MRLKYSKLSHNQTHRLLEHFVAGTPARPACLLVGVNKITATDFYHRLRLVITEKLYEEAGNWLMKRKSTSAISAGYGRKNEAVVRLEKSPSLVS